MKDFVREKNDTDLIFNLYFYMFFFKSDAAFCDGNQNFKNAC